MAKLTITVTGPAAIEAAVRGTTLFVRSVGGWELAAPGTLNRARRMGAQAQWIYGVYRI